MPHSTAEKKELIILEMKKLFRLKPMYLTSSALSLSFEYFDFNLIGTDVDLCEIVITNYTTRICEAELAGTTAVNGPGRPEMTRRWMGVWPEECRRDHGQNLEPRWRDQFN